jgi:putative peptidoglycan lipid II flippase
MALAIGLVPFTVQYVCLRAFYALEDTRTTFFLQCLIASINVVLGVAAVLLLDDPALVATGLAFSYSAAYLIGLPVSFSTLRRKLPDLDAEELVRHCVRLLLAVTPAAIAAWLISWAFTGRLGSQLALGLGLVVAGVVAVGMFLVLARLMGIHEVSEIVATLLRRGEDANRETLQTREEAVIEASGDRIADFGSSGDSPTVIRPPSPTIEGAGEEGAQAMVQATAAQGVEEGGDNLPAATLPAGTVLASRYRLEELIGETQPTVTWRAFDQVLSRSVLVHLLAPGDPGEDKLLTAARKASVATDSRFLRVLDAVHSSDPAVVETETVHSGPSPVMWCPAPTLQS